MIVICLPYLGAYFPKSKRPSPAETELANSRERRAAERGVAGPSSSSLLPSSGLSASRTRISAPMSGGILETASEDTQHNPHPNKTPKEHTTVSVTEVSDHEEESIRQARRKIPAHKPLKMQRGFRPVDFYDREAILPQHNKSSGMAS